RFVEQDVDFFARLELRIDELAVDLDVILFRISLRAEFLNYFTIDRDAPCGDQLLRVPSRSHSGRGNQFLKTLFHTHKYLTQRHKEKTQRHGGFSWCLCVFPLR